MASGYLHGVYTREVPTEILPPRRVDTNVVVAFGTAPVHTLKAGMKRPVNEPVLCYSYSEFVAAFGWSDDWRAYTLCEVADAVFAQYGMAPVVFVNVFDPATHVEAVSEEAHTFATDAISCAKIPVSGRTASHGLVRLRAALCGAGMQSALPHTVQTAFLIITTKIGSVKLCSRLIGVAGQDQA